MKRPISLLIALLMAASVLTACGNADSTASDPVTLPHTDAVTTTLEEIISDITSVTTAEVMTEVTTTAEEATTTEVTTTEATATEAVTTTEATTTTVTTTTKKTATTTEKASTTTKKTTTTPKTTTTAKPVTTTKRVVANDGEGRLAGIKIGIDPGHQRRSNSGLETVAPGSSEKKKKVSSGTQGVSTGIAEYVTVLEISLMLRDKLEAEGATVYMTRETHDVDISNQERAKMMNNYGVDLMLRVHCDGSSNSSARGIGLYVSKSNSIAKISYEYASIMLPIITQYTGANNRGVTVNDSYTGQNWAEVPCMMIECGFMSNKEDDKLLNDPAYQDKLTDGILEGMVACFAD